MQTTYRLVLNDGTNYDNIFEVSQINSFIGHITKENLPNCMIYVVGNDINLDQILNLVSRYNVPITIEKCDFKHLEINYIGQTKIIIRSCKIQELKIYGGTKINNTNRTLDIHFINCNVNNSEVSECQILSSFKLSAKSIFSKINFLNNSIGKIAIENSTIKNQISFTSINKSNIGEVLINENSNISTLLFLNVHLTSLDVSKAVIDKIITNDSNLVTEIKIEFCDKIGLEFNDCIIEYGGLIFNEVTNSHITFNKTRANNKLGFYLTNCSTSTLYINQCFYSNEVNFNESETAGQCINLSINETVFKELVIFKENQPQRLKLSNTLFQNGVLIPISEEQYGKIINPEKIHSSVWCILKNQAIQRNDKIIALSYRKYEMLSYTEELKWTKDKYAEKFVLYLNRFSNNHGLSWTRGIAFTIIVWLFFYSIYVCASNGFVITPRFETLILIQREFWINAVNFLWLPQGLQELTKSLTEAKNGFNFFTMIVSFIFGKVFIAYGIYQLVAAFRKHGKI